MRRALVVAGLVVMSPRTASAGDQSHPREPPRWTSPACATIVDRSTTPIAHFDYQIANQEIGPFPDDEPTDSRTHQFFAFRRVDFAAYNGGDRLPVWITTTDLQRAALVDSENVDPTAVSGESILETTSRFAAEDWMRITPDDARVPITHDQAALGVEWDVSEVAPGAYTIWGYTWEPVHNLWTPRNGFVKVIASVAESDDAGPAIALLPEEALLEAGDAHVVPGCVDAPIGSTWTLEWGRLEGTLEPQWHALIADEPIENGMLDVEVVFPNEAGGPAEGPAQVKLRATVTDPSRKQFVAYSPLTYAVIGEPDEGCGCAAGTGRGGMPLLSLFMMGLRRRRGGARLRT